MRIPAILLERTLSTKKWRRMQIFLLLKRQGRNGGSIAITNECVGLLARAAGCSSRTVRRSLSELYADRWIYKTRAGLTILNGWLRIRRDIERLPQRTTIHISPESGRFSLTWLKGLCFASGIHMLEKRKSASGIRSGHTVVCRPLQRPNTRTLKFNMHSNNGLRSIYGIGKNLIRKGKVSAIKSGLLKVKDNFHSLRCDARDLVGLKKYLSKSDQGGPLMIHPDGSACYRLPDLFASLL